MKNEHYKSTYFIGVKVRTLYRQEYVFNVLLNTYFYIC